MAVEFQNLTNAYSSDVSSRSGAAPAGFSEGDLFIAVVSAAEDYILFELLNPSGWTAIQSGYYSGADEVRSIVSYRIAQAGDTSWTWTTASTIDRFAVVILRYTGQSLISPIHSSGKSEQSGTPANAPSVGYTSINKDSIALQTLAVVPETLSNPPGQLDIRYLTSVWLGYTGGDKHISGTGSTGQASWTASATTAAVGLTVVIEAAKTFVPTINIF